MISKTFKYTELVQKNVTKTFPVFEPGTMLKVVIPYKDFKLGEIIIVHSSHLNSGQYKHSIQDEIYYNVTWFFIGEISRKTTSVMRDVTLWENYFEECTLKDLQKYIKANNGE